MVMDKSVHTVQKKSRNRKRKVCLGNLKKDRSSRDTFSQKNKKNVKINRSKNSISEFASSWKWPTNSAPKKIDRFFAEDFKFSPVLKSAFSQLPVIIEEEGNYENDEKELRNVLYCETKENVVSEKKIENAGTQNEGRNILKRVSLQPFKNLSPLTNISCMINLDMKQSKHIFDTNFGRKLLHTTNINRKLFQEGLLVKNAGWNLGGIKTGGGDIGNEQNAKTFKKTTFDICKRKGRRSKRASKVDNNREKTSDTSESKETSEEFSAKSQTSFNKDEVYSQDALSIPTYQSFPKNQYLTEWVKKILDHPVDVFTCELCEEVFPTQGGYLKHKVKHEIEKRICILCDDAFYTTKEFVQHLATHEGVDEFSCKQCRKYFPSLDEYKQHYQKAHSTLEKIPTIHVKNGIK